MKRDQFPKFRIDAELDLLKPVGPQGLFSEDPSKLYYNDNNPLRFDGYSNASGGGQNKCKNTCEGLFGKGDEKSLRDSCKSLCKSKCGLTNCHGFTPTRENICISRGLNADCTAKVAGTTSADSALVAATTAKQASPGADTSKSNKGLYIGLGVVALVVVGFVVYKKFKK